MDRRAATACAEPIAGLPSLTLASDLPPAKRAALASKMSLETPVQQCVSVGPFDDPAIAAKAATVLRRSASRPAADCGITGIRRFWVYLDGFRSDATEMRVLHRLEQAGIDDAEAMPADAGGLKVSLGLFTDRNRAASRVKVVHAMGFTPLMTERMLPGTVYWLDLTLPNGSARRAAEGRVRAGARRRHRADQRAALLRNLIAGWTFASDGITGFLACDAGRADPADRRSAVLCGSGSEPSAMQAGRGWAGAVRGIREGYRRPVGALRASGDRYN